MEKSLKEIPFAHEIVGVTSRQQLHFVPDADNEPKVGHEIPEPALFRYLLNEELWEQIKGSEVEIPEMLNVLKDIDKESKIVEFETHQSTMGKVEDFNGAFHVFIVFKSTSEADDEVYWWSLEKNLDYIVLQRSRNKENVKNKLDGEPREKVEPVKEGLKGKGTINDLFAMFWANQMILEEYHFIHQCQTLVTFIGKQITQEGYEYQDFFEYPILPDNGRNTKMLNLINILTVAVESCHPLFPLIYLENTDLVDKLRESGKYKMDDTREGCAPLHFAITLEKSKMVQHLLKPPAMNADPTTRNDQGRNALHLAASMFAMKAEIFDALLAHGKVKVNDVDDRGQTALHLAVSTSNAIAVRKLLEKGADPNIVDKDGMSPLHVAAQHREVNPTIDLLLAYSKVKVDDVDGDGQTALHWAASTSNVVVAKKLIEKGADPNIVDKDGMSPLHVAARKKDGCPIIDLLLEAQKDKGMGDVDIPNEKGRTALFYAAMVSNEITAEHLIKKGADLCCRDNYGFTPLHVAVRYAKDMQIIDFVLRNIIEGDIERYRKDERLIHDAALCNTHELGDEIVFRLRKKGIITNSIIDKRTDVNTRSFAEKGADPSMLDAFYGRRIAKAKNSQEIDEILKEEQFDINGRDENGETQLFFETRANNVEGVRRLLERGADPTIGNNDGYTPFRVAFILHKDSEILNLLLGNEKVDINETTSQGGWTALHVAISESNTATAEFLLSRGANPNVADVKGLTPLHVAALCAKFMDIVELLLNRKDVHVNCLDNAGDSALDYAMRNKHGLDKAIANRLKEKGAVERDNKLLTIDNGIKKMCSSKKVKNLLSDDTIPIEDKIDRISEQHLLSAIKDSNFEIVRNLLKNGADIRTCGEKGESALHLASRYAKTTDLIDFILETGKFDINGVDNDGLTPLHHAMMGSYSTKNVPHLIRLGADLTISDQKGNTPLHFAASHAKEMKTISLILEENKQIDINHINKDSETALHKAIVAKNVITARYLLDKGADPTIGEQTGNTPFHMAVGVFTDTDVLGLMLGNETKKIDINVRNDEGGTALHNAVMHSNVTAARFLLSNGANPNVADENGLTPLHLAVENAKDMDIVKLLLNHKDTNVNYLDNDLLDFAKYYNKHGIGGEIANLLKGKGAAKAEGRNHEPKNKAASVGLPADHITEDSDIKSGYAKAMKLDYFLLKTDLHGPTAPKCTSDDNNDNMVKEVLEEAIEDSDTEKIRNLIEMGADLGKTMWREGANALHLASRYAKTTDLIDVILKTGEFDIDGTDKQRLTPLHHAISGTYRAEINARYLLVQGADPTIRDHIGNTPFHLAAMFSNDYNVFDLMLRNEKKVDIDKKNNAGKTALHIAVLFYNVTTARFLLSNGANPNVADENGLTPLHLAVENAKDMDIVKLLLNHNDVNVNYLNNRGYNALHCARNNFHGLGEAIANLLREKMAAEAEGINYGPKNNIAALAPAGRIKARTKEEPDIKTIRFLIENGMDISVMTWGENGTNALHVAAAHEKTTDVIDVILETGKLDINGVDNDGNTPLHHAIKGSDSTTNAPHLIQLGADPNIADKNGITPLHLAAKNAETTELIDIILESGQCNINPVDNDGRTPLHYAIKRPDPVTINARRLIKMGADPSIADKNGVTPLHMAARNAESMDLIELLLNTEAVDVNCVDIKGRTPLACARDNKHGLSRRIIARLKESRI